MKARVGENKKAALFGALTALAVLVLLPAFVGADTFPYFDVGTGSIFAGGGFYANPTTSCATSDADYQSPDFSTLANLNGSAKKAGILAYGTGGTGANSDLSAQALGLIESDGGNSPGLDFFSGPSSNHALNFANDLTGSAQPSYSTNYGGGLFSGGSGSPYCIFDYYGAFAPSSDVSTAATYSIANMNANADGNYRITPAGGKLTFTGGIFTAGNQQTLFVNGDLYITSDITYTPGTDASASSATKLAFVVKGNIYVQPWNGTTGVKTIDGWYIAQPKTLADAASGFVYTCSDGANATPSTPPISAWLKTNCEGPAINPSTGKLTVNGAVTDKWTVLDREICGLQSASCAAVSAESFNFTNEMTLGGPFFSQQTPTSTSTLDSLVSLPPVF